VRTPRAVAGTSHEDLAITYSGTPRASSAVIMNIPSILSRSLSPLLVAFALGCVAGCAAETSSDAESSADAVSEGKVQKALTGADHITVSMNGKTFTLGAPEKIAGVLKAFGTERAVAGAPRCPATATLEFHKGAKSLGTVRLMGCAFAQLANGKMYEMTVAADRIQKLLEAPLVVQDVLYGTISELVTYPDKERFHGEMAAELPANLGMTLTAPPARCASAINTGTTDMKKEYFGAIGPDGKAPKLGTIELFPDAQCTASPNESSPTIASRVLGPDGKSLGYLDYALAVPGGFFLPGDAP
jgi:hypothetical protein